MVKVKSVGVLLLLGPRSLPFAQLSVKRYITSSNTYIYVTMMCAQAKGAKRP